MKKILFKDWIVQFKDYDSPIGDLAFDISRDKNYPVDNQTFSNLAEYFDWVEFPDDDHPLERVSQLFFIAWSFYNELIENVI